MSEGYLASEMFKSPFKRALKAFKKHGKVFNIEAVGQQVCEKRRGK